LKDSQVKRLQTMRFLVCTANPCVIARFSGDDKSHWFLADAFGQLCGCECLFLCAGGRPKKV